MLVTMFKRTTKGQFAKGYRLRIDPRNHSKANYKGIPEWIVSHQGKHICECGCGTVLTIKEHHFRYGIPRFISGHRVKLDSSAVSSANRKKRGDKHWNWRGGITSLYERMRKCEEYKQWRKQVFQRDNYTCRDCGIKNGVDGKNHPLEAHHIIPFGALLHAFKHDMSALIRVLTDVSNGITLCEDCHAKIPLPKIERNKPRGSV